MHIVRHTMRTQSARRRVWPLTRSYGCALNQAQCQEWRGFGPKCVPVTNVCDGIYHCYDHSDELNCSMSQLRARRLPNGKASRYPSSSPFGL